MMRLIRLIRLGVIITAMMGMSALASGDYDDDWKVTVGGKAKSGGVISFKLTFEPEDGVARDPVTVDAPIPEKTGENDTADMIGNAFRAILGEDDFSIDVSWGENVKIKAKRNVPDFMLTIEGNSVQGISLEIED